MADKLTQQILEALTRCAATPSGLPLYSSKADAGLFPNTAGAKTAAQKCLTDDLVRITGTDTKAKSPRDLYGLTEKGWEFLLAAVNPKQVLEDFVRVLESRQGEVSELLSTARRMADSLQGLKEAVARVLPVVSEKKIQKPYEEPNPLTPFPKREGGTGERQQGDAVAAQTPPSLLGKGAGGLGSSAAALAPPSLLGKGAGGLGCLCEDTLASPLLAHLAEHRGPTDCTLPELFRVLVMRNPAPSIGEFHDCLRTLYADGAIALHSWTAPLYTMPEPQFALLVGHDVAYYASLKSGQWIVDSGQ